MQKKTTKKATKKKVLKVEIKNLTKLKRCPACGSSNIIYEKRDDELLCHGCGTISVRLVR